MYMCTVAVYNGHYKIMLHILNTKSVTILHFVSSLGGFWHDELCTDQTYDEEQAHTRAYER